MTGHILPHDAGSLLVTAGGTDLCIWHLLHSGQLVRRVTAHQKTVTSVVVGSLGGAEPHVLTAGLDGHVKVRGAPWLRALGRAAWGAAHARAWWGAPWA